MNFKITLLSCLFVFSTTSTFAASSAPKTKEVMEEEVKFSYASADGEFKLKCTHYLDNPETHDFDVWCGKGTPYLRTFRIHFMVRQHDKPEQGKSAFEVLYWVIDRNQEPSRKFSSGNAWISFKNPSDLERMSFDQGVENDYAYLSVEYKPH